MTFEDILGSSLREKRMLSVLKSGKCCKGGHCTCLLDCSCGCKRCVCSGGFR